MPTSSTVTALRMPPALSKAQGKLRRPAPRADFSMMKMAPMEPSRGPAVTSSGGLAEAEASRLMLSLANSSMLQPAGNSRRDTLTHTRAHRLQTYTRASRRRPVDHSSRTVLRYVGRAARWARWASWTEEGGVGLMEGSCCLQVPLGNGAQTFKDNHRGLTMHRF